MKTILLQFKANNSGLKLQRWQVESESGGILVVSHTHVFRDKSSSTDRYTLTRQVDGSFVSNTGCEYIQAKLDRRPKPYSVSAREFGRGPASVKKFATVEEITKYVMDRWQGWDYYDGDNAFHSDYCAYAVRGVELSALVPPREEA